MLLKNAHRNTTNYHGQVKINLGQKGLTTQSDNYKTCGAETTLKTDCSHPVDSMRGGNRKALRVGKLIYLKWQI